MSAQLAREFKPTVIPFPSRDRAATSNDLEFSSGIPDGFQPNQMAELIAAIEALSYQSIVEKELRGISSPFDAIYLSALQLDSVSRQSPEMLRRFASIEDRSEQITFEDGLD